MGTSSSDRAKSPAAGLPKGKLALAAVLLLVAGLVLARSFGLIGGGAGPKEPPPLTPEAQAERDEAVRITKERHEQLEKETQQGSQRGPG